MSKLSLIISGLAFLALAFAPALGQAQTEASKQIAAEAEADPKPQDKSFGGAIFLGVGAAPDYLGSQDYDPIPLVGARLHYEHYYATLFGPSLTLNIVPSPIINAGPIIKYQGGRDDDVENEAVSRLAEIDDGVEAGAFVRLNMKPGLRKGDRAGVELKGLADASGAYDGWALTMKADYKTPITKKLTLGFDVSATYADENYMESFFGISSATVDNSGLNTFTAEEGIRDVAFGLNLGYQFTEAWGVSGMVSYTQLLGDAADSPIVDQEGNAGQVFGGVMATYRF